MMLFQKQVSLIVTTLEKLKIKNKGRKHFLIHLFTLLMGMRDRYNFLNMERYGQYNEKTYRNQYEKGFDFFSFNAEMIKTNCSRHIIIAFDQSYLPKSGKATPYIDKYWSGSAGQALKGLEIGCLAAIDIDNHTAMPLEVVQTPDMKTLKQADKTLVDWYATSITKHADRLKTMSKYVVGDGYFAKEKFVNKIRATGLHLISKFRNDADLRYIHEGKTTGKVGRPKMYDGKVDVKNIDKTKISYCGEEKLEKGTVKLYSGIVYSIRLKCKVKIVYIEYYEGDKYKGYTILFSTDTEINSLLIYKYYKARFQIEFLFRDAKQYAGLTHCQARSKNKLHFHFNASVTTVGVAKVVHYLTIDKKERKSFSMSDIKTMYLNKLIADKMIESLNISLSQENIINLYSNILTYGKKAS